ncbi:MAG: SDR family NAD(P)-dependent oxidoreductase [Desulfobacula sp.]|nr:SDR family NAD(P)-dependent oxidoreductase [Desulfobacula sp.]
MKNLELKGKTAVVTGVGRGIGEMIALTLALEGADIVVNDINPVSAKDTAKKINSIGRETLVSLPKFLKVGLFSHAIAPIRRCGSLSAYTIPINDICKIFDVPIQTLTVRVFEK